MVGMCVVAVVMMISPRCVGVTMIIEGDHAYVVLVAAAAGQAHDSTTISTEVTCNSRPATIWTSALPHGQSSSN